MTRRDRHDCSPAGAGAARVRRHPGGLPWPGAPPPGAEPTPRPHAGSTPDDETMAIVTCYRTHGDPSFPDPVYDPSDGRWHFAVSPGSAPASTQQACQHLFPSRTPHRPSRRHSSSSSSGWPSASGSTACPPGPTRTRTARTRCRRRSTEDAGRRGGLTAASSTYRAGASMSTRSRSEPPRPGHAGVALAAAAGFGARSAWPSATRPVRPGHGGGRDRPRAAYRSRGPSAGGGHARLSGLLHRRKRAGRDSHLAAGAGDHRPPWRAAVRRLRGAGDAALRLGPRVAAFVLGMTAGPDVRQLQRNLAALGFDPGPADGVFGWTTEVAVQRWQRAAAVSSPGRSPWAVSPSCPDRCGSPRRPSSPVPRSPREPASSRGRH